MRLCNNQVQNKIAKIRSAERARIYIPGTSSVVRCSMIQGLYCFVHHTVVYANQSIGSVPTLIRHLASCRAVLHKLYQRPQPCETVSNVNSRSSAFFQTGKNTGTAWLPSLNRSSVAGLNSSLHLQALCELREPVNITSLPDQTSYLRSGCCDARGNSLQSYAVLCSSCSQDSEFV